MRLVGISIQNHQPANVLKALDTGLIDSVQVIYNIFDQSPEDELFPYCEEHGIGVIVRVPFDEGALTGKLKPDTKFPEGDFRHNYFSGKRKEEVWKAVQAIVHDTGITLDELPSRSAALLFDSACGIDGDSRDEERTARGGECRCVRCRTSAGRDGSEVAKTQVGAQLLATGLGATNADDPWDDEPSRFAPSRFTIHST